MATFTSTQNGNWNDGITWGNTSPGTKGIDWPGVAADTAIIGHTVIYNVLETNEMGAVTVNSGGILTVLTTASTKLTLGNVNLRINNGGELRWGNSGTRVASANVAEIIWNSTTDTAVGLYIENGAIINIYGDPTYYGSNDETSLADNVENTDGDTIIITNDDMSALWNVGDELTIKIEDIGDTTSFTDAIVLGVIQSMSGTSITLDITITAATGVGNTWASSVTNVTRNVRLLKLSASIVIGNYNINRPLIYDLNVSGNNNCTLDNVSVTGFYSINSNYDFKFLSSVFRNGKYGFNSGSNHTISGIIYSCQYAVNFGSKHTVTGNIYSCQYAATGGSNYVLSSNIYSCVDSVLNCSNLIISGNIHSNAYAINSGSNHTISGNIYSNLYGFYFGSNHTISGNVYSNQYGFRGGIDFILEGKIGYNTLDVSSPNLTYDFQYESFVTCVILAGKLPLGGLTFSLRGGEGDRGGIYSEDHEQVIGASYAYLAHGDIIKNTSILRSGGADNSIEVVPMTTCDADNPVDIFEWTEFDVPATVQTRSVYIKGESWTTWPTASQLYFEAEYFDVASGVTKTIVTSTAVLVDNITWTQFLVSFTPGQVGKVHYRMFLKLYEATAKVYIDSRLN